MSRFKKILSGLIMATMMLNVGCSPENIDLDVKVTTYTPQDITQTTAVCGGDVIVTQGLSLNELGVCWSKSPNPTVDDSHISTTNWNEPYVCTIMVLAPGTTYHIRAYALRGLEYYYGDDKSFTTEGNNGSDGHSYVDLGLPWRTLWATCNIGADTPEDCGDYFSWGESVPRTAYDWSTYKYCNGDKTQLTKYCNHYLFGYDGFTDELTTLLPEDDAATINWGSEWCMPTETQWKELYQNTTQSWVTQNGVNGCLFIAANGNCLFLPAAGGYWADGLHNVGLHGYYWSSLLSWWVVPYQARYFCFFSDNQDMCDGDRAGVLPVRAVRTMP